MFIKTWHLSSPIRMVQVADIAVNRNILQILFTFSLLFFPLRINKG